MKQQLWKVLLPSVLAISCGTLSQRTKRMLATTAGASIGLTLGNHLAESKSPDHVDKKATVYLNTSIGLAAGYSAGEYFFGGPELSDDYEKLRKTNDLLKGTYHVPDDKQSLKEIRKYLKPSSCLDNDKVSRLCSDDQGQLIHCSQREYFFVSPKYMTTYEVFYSLCGCFKGGKGKPLLKKYLGNKRFNRR